MSHFDKNNVHVFKIINNVNCVDFKDLNVNNVVTSPITPLVFILVKTTDPLDISEYKGYCQVRKLDIKLLSHILQPSFAQWKKTSYPI